MEWSLGTDADLEDPETDADLEDLETGAETDADLEDLEALDSDPETSAWYWWSSARDGALGGLEIGRAHVWTPSP